MMQTLLLSLHAQTNIHAGSGQADSVIDLPVQRESHTGYPCVFGSSMKGALRAHFETRTETDAHTINRLFGKEGSGDDGSAGAVMVSDARLLLLPIRSLTGQFYWVTCPSVLGRYQQDLRRFGHMAEFAIPTVASENVLTHKGEGRLYLEEYCFETTDTIDEDITEALLNTLTYDDGNALKDQLAIISNDDFAYLAKYTLPVNPHIAIDSATKTTKNGALWYEESLPSDTVLYLGLAVENERKPDGEKAATLASTIVQQLNGNWLQIGGNETVGMGWCGITVTEGQA